MGSGCWRIWLGLGGWTLLAALIVGYHPYAEDGGIYLAEIKRVLDPGLYPVYSEFVAAHLGRWPGFVDGVGWLVRATGWPLEWVMLGVHLGCLGALLAGVWGLARRCFQGSAGRWGAVGLVAVCCGMPVAGTSLMLVDPYVTARSVAVALTVLGMVGVAGFAEGGGLKRLGWTLVALGLGVALHPLMGGYGVGETVVLGCLLSGRKWVRLGAVFLVAGIGAAVAAGMQAAAPVETAEYVRVAATRYYWFLGEWQWYELLGVVAPLGILGWIGWRGRGLVRALGRMGVAVGGMAVLIAMAFGREAGRLHAVARMQPLRCFWMVYLVMLMVLGGWLGEKVLRGTAWRWGLAVAALGGLMVFVQRQTYPRSGHLEVPGTHVVNQWEEAFLWVRENTPKDALFGLDADYVHRPGEDAQVFRAVAERSALPDYSKDGGQAAIRPALTGVWMAGQEAQAGLTGETDGERVRKLGGLGVTWVVMGREARTGFVCPYTNERVMVCRLGR